MQGGAARSGHADDPAGQDSNAAILGQDPQERLPEPHFPAAAVGVRRADQGHPQPGAFGGGAGQGFAEALLQEVHGGDLRDPQVPLVGAPLARPAQELHQDEGEPARGTQVRVHQEEGNGEIAVVPAQGTGRKGGEDCRAGGRGQGQQHQHLPDIPDLQEG